VGKRHVVDASWLYMLATHRDDACTHMYAYISQCENVEVCHTSGV